MEELLAYIVKFLVTKPEEIEINSGQNEYGETVLKLKVAQEDMGRVIGKQGKIIKAIRDLIRVAAVKDGSKVRVELVDSAPLGKPEETAIQEPLISEKSEN